MDWSSIQDLGGAGIVCATSETAARGAWHGRGRFSDPASRGGNGTLRDHDVREPGTDARHHHPENWDAVAKLCAKWEVRATVIGHVVEPTIDENGRAVAMLRVRQGFDGEILAEVPASSLADEALSTIDR